MGATQRQAVPLLTTEAPLVGTGTEQRAAHDSGEMVIAQHSGVVTGFRRPGCCDHGRRWTRFTASKKPERSNPGTTHQRHR